MKDREAITQVVLNSKRPIQNALIKLYRDLKYRRRQLNFDDAAMPLLKDFYTKTINEAFNWINVTRGILEIIMF